MIKITICLILTALAAFSLCACGRTGDAPAASADPEAMAEETAIPTIDPTAVSTEIPAPTAAPTATPVPTEAPKPTAFHYDLEIPVYTDYDLLRPIDWRLDYSEYGGTSYAFDYTMEKMLAKLPTNAVRTRFDGSKYAIYDTDTGYRLYVFFQGYDPYFYATGFPLLIKEVHSYEDFASIKPGDPIADVIKIDPIDSRYVDSYEGKTQYRKSIHGAAEGGHPIAFVHYLTDGVLKISYDMTEDGRLIVYDMVYSEDYKLIGNTGELFSYKLFDIDLPQP